MSIAGIFREANIYFMNKKLLFTFLGLGIFAGSLSLMHPTAAENNGSPGGYTGSPNDDNCTDCHNGSAPVLNSPKPSLTTTIPGSGWVSGQTYSFTVSITGSTNKHGFEIIGYEGTNNGTFVSNTNVKTLSSAKRATHKSASTSGNGGRSWTFDWIAPSNSTLDSICFYYAVLAANGNNNDNGDIVYLKNECFNQAVSVRVDEASIQELRAYPNPLTQGSVLTLESPNTLEAHIEWYDLKGSVILSYKTLLNQGQNQLNTTSLPKGVYLLKVRGSDLSLNQQVMIY